MTPVELKTRLQKTVQFLESDLLSVRVGRATPSILEDLVIDAYGTKMKLKEVGSITAQDSTMLVVSPWDKGHVGAIAKVIRESDLNLNPTEDGLVVRVPIPPLTEERRVELAKLVSKKVEEAKQSVRNIRQEFMKDVDKRFTEKLIGEDVKFTEKEDAEKIVKDAIAEIDEHGESKKKDLMTL